MPNRTRTVTADQLLAGDEVYIDGRILVTFVAAGEEPVFAPGEPVTIVHGTNPFGALVSRWTRTSATYRVTR